MPKRPLPEPGESGTVYLVHLSQPISHARHYIGWASDTTVRLSEHRAGRGSRLLAAANQRDVGYEVTRVWDGQDRRFERRLKNQANAWRLCPACNPAGWKTRMPEAR